MDCRDVREELLDGDGELSGRAETHLRDCSACRELADGRGRLPQLLDGAEPGAGGETGGSTLTFEDLRDEIAREQGALSAFRDADRTTRTAVLAALVLGVAAGVFVVFPRADLQAYPPLRFWLLGTGFYTAAVGCLFAALRPVYRPALSGRSVAAGLAAALGYAVAAAALPAAHATEPFIDLGVGSELLPAATACFGFGSLCALPVAAAGWLAVRSRPRFLTHGFLLAAAAGLVGDLALHAHCPMVRTEHLLLGHATVPAASTLAYGLVAYIEV